MDSKSKGTETRERVLKRASQLRLPNLRQNLTEILERARREEPSYLGFLDTVLDGEIKRREETRRARSVKQACFPEPKTLNEFELEGIEGLSGKNLNRLSECEWIRQHFNLVLIGPPGIGKTHLSIALGMEAIDQGFSVSFATVKELVDLLGESRLNVRDKARQKRLYTSDLVIVDELGYYPFSRREAGCFFHFLNAQHGKSSFLITSNKPFNQWPEFFGDEDLVLAALDRLLYHCDVVKLKGRSYRLENRQSLLD